MLTARLGGGDRDAMESQRIGRAVLSRLVGGKQEETVAANVLGTVDRVPTRQAAWSWFDRCRQTAAGNAE